MDAKTEKIQLQERDYALLLGLFECRVMTRPHVSALHFGGKAEYAKKRLQKLMAAQLVGERKRQVNEPSILFLTRKGFSLLKKEGRLSDFPPLGADSFAARADVSSHTLVHELEIMDVKAAFHRGMADSDKFSIAEFSTWPALNQFEIAFPGIDRLRKPDAYIRIHEREGGSAEYFHDCFLEVDRSTKDQGRLAEQVCAYLDYYKSGDFAVRCGGTRATLTEFPFRVLIVFKSAERRNNAAERLLQNNPPILTMAWLATLADVKADPLGAVWICPADYREATKGTAFDPGRLSAGWGYRRQPEREALVEKAARKRFLLG